MWGGAYWGCCVGWGAWTTFKLEVFNGIPGVAVGCGLPERAWPTEVLDMVELGSVGPANPTTTATVTLS